MSEIVLYVVCFALGCAVGWFVALWGFEKVIRLLARVYENGDTEFLLCKIKERAKKERQMCRYWLR